MLGKTGLQKETVFKKSELELGEIGLMLPALHRVKGRRISNFKLAWAMHQDLGNGSDKGRRRNLHKLYDIKYPRKRL